jgi:hypothetical protein
MENQNENHTLESETKMFEEAVDCLTKGLINIYEPGLSQVEKMLKELTWKVKQKKNVFKIITLHVVVKKNQCYLTKFIMRI